MSVNHGPEEVPPGSIWETPLGPFPLPLQGQLSLRLPKAGEAAPEGS